MDINEELLKLENLLNEHSGKRYHIKPPTEQIGISLVEVKKIGDEQFIQTCSTSEQLYVWIKTHLSVEIKKDD